MRGSRLVGFATVLIVFLVAAPFLFGNEMETETLEVIGEAIIYNQDVVAAKEAALEDAFRIAVRRTIGTWVTAESFTRNFISIEDSIFTKTRGYIKTYETLAVTVTESIVTVEARVTVSVSPLQADLQSLLGAMDNPQFIVLSEDPFLKETLEKELKTRGFLVAVCPQEECPQEITPEAITEIYENCFAEVLVLAEMDVENCTKTGSMWGYVIALSAESFWLDTAERLVESSARANGAGVNQEMAIKQAIGRASPELINTFVGNVVEAWSDFLLNGRRLEISIIDVSYGDLIKLRHRLDGIYGVRNVIQRKFEEGEALLEAYFTGSSQTLADLISTTNFRDIVILITAVGRGTINLTVIQR